MVSSRNPTASGSAIFSSGRSPWPEALRARWRDAVDRARAGGRGCLIILADPNAAGFYLAMGATAAGARPSEVDPARPLSLFRFPLH